MRKAVIIISIILLAALTILFALTFKNRVARPYNSEGNYFDENSVIVYQEQAILVYGLITLLFLGLTVLIGYIGLFKKHKE